MKDYKGLRSGKLIALEFDKKEGIRVSWLFSCDCGNIVSKRVDRVFCKRRPYLSCGCWNKRHVISEDTPKKLLYREYNNGANDRGIGFDITYDYFVNIIVQNCFYCGVEPLSVKQGFSINSASFLRNGIDRVDNNKGYEIGNCVPCCAICNRAKRDLEYDVFMSWIERLKKRPSD